MEDNTELLEKYIEEGKLPLKGELFSRKVNGNGEVKGRQPCIGE